MSSLYRNILKRRIWNIQGRFKSAAHETSLDSSFICRLLYDVRETSHTYGFHTEYFKKLPVEKILVEFSSPNIAKLFHAGHYRSTVIGNVISNILTAAGHDVCKINYLGDWGVQFALLAVAFKNFGNGKLLQEKPLQHLFDLYVKITKEAKENTALLNEAQQIFRNMEDGNPESLEFWSYCRDLSIKEYEKLYEEIGVSFNVYSGESQYITQSKAVLQSLRDKAMLYDDENALKVNLTNSAWLSNCDQSIMCPALARSNGTTLYLTRDIAAAIDRYERFNFDRMIYITDKSQETHFKQLFGVLDLMGYPWAEKNAKTLTHKTFGRVQKMQTRKGSIVFLRDILEEAYERAFEDRRNCVTRKADLGLDEITKTMALSGLIYHDLKSYLDKGYKFNWETALASKGSSGLYLQYTYSRLCSLERYTGVDVVFNIDPNCVLEDPNLLLLLKHVSDYPDVAMKIYETLEPSHLVRYLFDLCRVTSRAFVTCIVKDQEPSVAQARLVCFHCARIVLENGLRLLGITPLEQH